MTKRLEKPSEDVKKFNVPFTLLDTKKIRPIELYAGCEDSEIPTFTIKPMNPMARKKYRTLKLQMDEALEEEVKKYGYKTVLGFYNSKKEDGSDELYDWHYIASKLESVRKNFVDFEDVANLLIDHITKIEGFRLVSGDSFGDLYQGSIVDLIPNLSESYINWLSSEIYKISELSLTERLSL